MLICGIIVGIGIFSAMHIFSGSSILNGNGRETVIGDDAANADLTMRAFAVLEYISNDDFNSLSQAAHPEFGIVFSPCATIDLSTDRRFSIEQISTLDTDSNIYIWGVHNGSGEPIRLTAAEYFEEFVQAELHLNSPIIGVNQIIRSGNALENITDVFPNIEFVDFHIPGDENSDGHDWRSLRLGFEEYDGYLKLVSIIHSTWAA
ncbi:MAG: hypothetical protein FWD05_08120 [Oscillospiraceae bacterium]|nr:hypothetical protein [Oscillospiraceae bacterium]